MQHRQKRSVLSYSQGSIGIRGILTVFSIVWRILGNFIMKGLKIVFIFSFANQPSE